MLSIFPQNTSVNMQRGLRFQGEPVLPILLYLSASSEIKVASIIALMKKGFD